jgi:hypothetical protein
MTGIEPARREALDPKSSMSTSSITSALLVSLFGTANIHTFKILQILYQINFYPFLSLPQTHIT